MTKLRARRVLPLWPYAGLIALIGIVNLWGLGGYGFVDSGGLFPDEGRCAEIAREMLESGDFITPRLNALPVEEWPLMYWITAGSLLLLGESEFAARLPAVLLGLGGCALTFFLSRRLVGSWRAGGFSAVALATSVLWFAMSRFATEESAASFFIALSLLSYHGWVEREIGLLPSPLLSDGEFLAAILLSSPALEYREGKRPFLFHASMALATLSIGLFGTLMPLGIAGLHLCLTLWRRPLREWGALLRLLSPFCVALYLALVAPWLWAYLRANPDAQASRFLLPGSPGSYGPLWLFFVIILLSFAPWTGLSLDILHAARGKWDVLSRNDRLFLFLWFLLPLTVCLASPSRLASAFMPCMPPLSVLAGAAMEVIARAGRGRGAGFGIIRRFTGLNTIFLLPLSLGMWLCPTMSSNAAVQAVAGITVPIAAALLLFYAASLLLLLLPRMRMATRGRLSLLLCCLAVGVLIALIPALKTAAERGSSREVSMSALNCMSEGDRIIAFRSAASGLPFYLKRRIAVACAQDVETDGRWFLDGAQLRRLWNGAERTLLVSRREDIPRLMDTLGREPVRLAETARYILFTNF